MFGSKQRIKLADSSLERETYETLEAEKDLAKILERMTFERDQKEDEDVINASIQYSVCEDFGITHAAFAADVKQSESNAKMLKPK